MRNMIKTYPVNFRKARILVLSDGELGFTNWMAEKKRVKKMKITSVFLVKRLKFFFRFCPFITNPIVEEDIRTSTKSPTGISY